MALLLLLLLLLLLPLPLAPLPLPLVVLQIDPGMFFSPPPEPNNEALDTSGAAELFPKKIHPGTCMDCLDCVDCAMSLDMQMLGKCNCPFIVNVCACMFVFE
mmetsp:Transcript_14969/g.26007  ORF Transcript_14969/g.26007 Transcript_14969/m.26007 type:complete len:102 (+) Transcript_14969:1102-1407(+)